MPKDHTSSNKKSSNQDNVKGSKSKYNESKKNQGNHNSQDENQEAILCKSLPEAESKVLELLNQGRPYNELTKIQFKIEDRIKRFNPSQISKISKNADSISNQSSNSNKISVGGNPVTTIFELLKKGKSLTDIVIQTDIEPDVVNAAFKQYLEFENYVLCPKQIYYKMHSLVLADYRKHEDPNYPSSQIGFEEIWADLTDLHQEYENLVISKLIFKCSNCKEWTDPDKEDRIDAIVYLSEHNVCHKCV